MKTQALAILLALLAAVLAPTRAIADADVSFQFFYDNLSPHGEWIEVGDYGECWQPNGVDADWSPYTDGYWSYTDAGWTWVSYEDFGGITYHYGRWVRADEVGWCWVPDTEWGPAWVSWRNNDDYVGWAPLPPEATFQASVGISTWVDDSYDIGPGYYNFCPVVEFGAPLIRAVCVPRFEVIGIFGRSRNVTNISYNSYSDVVFGGGPSFSFINERSYRPIPALKLVQNFNITNINVRGGRFNSWNEGNTLQVYAPKIVKNTTIINKPRITKVVNKERVNRGWDVVKDPEEKQRLRAKLKEDSKGRTAENAPARKFDKEDLKGVPTKADVKAPSPVAKGGRRDTDGDGIANRKDKDKDSDGIRDNQQPGKIAEDRGGKGKGRAGADRTPANGGVSPTGGPTAKDRDGDGISNRLDKDKDGNGVRDRQPGKAATERPETAERSPAAEPTPGKTRNGPDRNNGKVRRDDDGDGIPNRADKDKDGDGERDNRPGADALRRNPGVNPNLTPQEDRERDRAGRGQGGGRGGFQQPDATSSDPSDSNSRGGRRGGIGDQPGSQRDERDGQANAARRQAAMADRQQQLEKQQRQAERAQQMERQDRQPERQRLPQQGFERQQRQAERAQQAERLERQQPVQRQPNFQRPEGRQAPPHFQPPMQQQAPRQGGGGGGGGGGQGKGKRNLTPEEAAALQKQRGR